MNVFLIGIAGGTGGRVARLLARRGDTVGGLYRRPEQLAGIRAAGATGVLGDVATISEPDLAAAIAGADAVVFAAGAGDQDDEARIDAVDDRGVSKLIAAAGLAGVARLVLVSVFPEAWRERHLGDSFEHYMAAKKRADVALVHSGLDWLILRPSVLTDEPGTGRVSLSPAEIHTEISRDDVAATAAALLHTRGLQNRLLEVTGGGESIADAVAAQAGDGPR